VFTLFSATIGAGILGLPYAIEQSGAILGISLVIGAAILNYFTAILLVLAGNKTKQYRYFELAKGYGKTMTMCVKVIFFLNNWGIVVGYTTLINILIS
jgi:sodium-coupled neutral amino acid transporter 11